MGIVVLLLLFVVLSGLSLGQRVVPVDLGAGGVRDLAILVFVVTHAHGLPRVAGDQTGLFAPRLCGYAIRIMALTSCGGRRAWVPQYGPERP